MLLVLHICSGLQPGPAAFLPMAGVARSCAPLCCADKQLQTARRETVAAEEEVEKVYASMKAGTSPGDDAAAVRQLHEARARLAELRMEEARRACEARLQRCSGGEAAAEALEDLRYSGVAPDSMCHRRALAACGGEVGAACHLSSRAEGLAEEAQWAQLIFSEAGADGCAGPIELALALRPCALSRRWDVASDLLLAGQVDPQEASHLLYQSLLQQLDGVAPLEAQARADAMLAERLLTALPFPQWDPSRLVLKMGGLPPAAAGVVLSAALDDLCQAQAAAGPQQSLIGSGLTVELSLADPACMPDLGAEGGSLMSGGVGEAAATFWSARGEVLGDRLLPDSLCLSLKQAVACALEAAGVVSSDVSEGRVVAGRRSCLVQVQRRSLEGWVLDRCLRLWQGQVVRTEFERRQAEAQQARAAAAAAAITERRQNRWERKNRAALDQYHQEARNERSSVAVALDNIGFDAARKAKLRGRAKTGSAPPATFEDPTGGEVEALQGRAPHISQPSRGEWDAILADSAALVEEVAGIGPKRAEKLRAEGIVTASQLALLDDGGVQRLASRSGIPIGVLSVCMRDARQLIKAATAKKVGKASNGGEEHS